MSHFELAVDHLCIASVICEWWHRGIVKILYQLQSASTENRAEVPALFTQEGISMVRFLSSDIIIVSGLPRSGTSMMMRMLEAGGIEPVTDNIRQPDEDNLRGYYEFERVKKIKEDKSWLPQCEGKAVKMISMLLYDLPFDRRYKIIFMQRSMPEVLASQRVMLQRRGEMGAPVDDAKMAHNYEKHLQHIAQFLSRQNQCDVLYVRYNDILEDPARNIAVVNGFLSGILNTERMAAAVEKNLYRQRKQ